MDRLKIDSRRADVNDCKLNLGAAEQALREANAAVDAWEIDTDAADVVEMYESSLRDSFGDSVSICGMDMDPVAILKEMDETAYRCGMNDWTDGLDKSDFEDYRNLEDTAQAKEEERDTAAQDLEDAEEALDEAENDTEEAEDDTEEAEDA